MPEENVSLEDLERLLSQRLEEVQRLQHEIEQRKAQAQFDELTTLRQSLEEQLREVNDKIAGIRLIAERAVTTQTTSIIPAILPATSIAEESEAQVEETKTVETSPAVTEDASTPRVNKKVRTRRLILDVLEKSAQPLRAKEIIEQILQTGIELNGKDVPHMVWLALSRLKKRQALIYVKVKYCLPATQIATNPTPAFGRPAYLSSFILRVLEKSTKPLPPKEVANKVRRARFVSKSKDVSNTVRNALIGLKRRNLIVREADGYRLKKVSTPDQGHLSAAPELSTTLATRESVAIPVEPASTDAVVEPAPVQFENSISPVEAGTTLLYLLLQMVREGRGQPVTVKEMTDELRRQHPDMTTKKLRHLVHAKLADLLKKGILTHSRT